MTASNSATPKAGARSLAIVPVVPHVHPIPPVACAFAAPPTPVVDVVSKPALAADETAGEPLEDGLPDIALLDVEVFVVVVVALTVVPPDDATPLAELVAADDTLVEVLAEDAPPADPVDPLLVAEAPLDDADALLDEPGGPVGQSRDKVVGCAPKKTAEG
jgi:hypothetical protein